MELLQLAAMVSKAAHHGQFRKYSSAHDPYVLHPMRVSGLVLLATTSGASKEDLMCTALLHDVLEDCPLCAADLVGLGIPKHIVDYVEHLTKGPSKGSREENVKAMLGQIHHAPYVAKVVKLADRCDNLTDMVFDPLVPLQFAKQYAAEGRMLREALEGTDTFLETRLEVLASRICG